MLILLSPSKNQDFKKFAPTKRGENPELLNEAKVPAKALKEVSSKKLEKLMSISKKLADFTYERAQKWTATFGDQKMGTDELLNKKQAIFAYTGDVYRVFESGEFDSKDLTYLQNNVRILSGLYGITKPLTYIKPYRLEMGTTLPLTKGKKKFMNLYEYWQPIITEYIEKNFKKDEPIINLASQEYAKAANLEQYGERVYTIHFKVKRDGKLKTIGLIAKRQRGEMTYWLMKKRISDPKDIKKYKGGGFAYSKEHSTDHELVFVM